MKENNIVIAILLVATICLLFKQNNDTVSSLTTINEKADRILASQPTQRMVPTGKMPIAETNWEPTVYQWPDTNMTPVSLGQDWQADASPAEPEWGKETSQKLKDFEISLKQSDVMHTSHDRRLDSLESKLAALELRCSGATASRAPSAKSVAKSFDVMSIDQTPEAAPNPPPIYIEQAPPNIIFQSAPVYRSPLPYGSTGSSAAVSSGPSYGSIGTSIGDSSFSESPQFTSTRIVRRPVQQTRSTSYGPVMGATRLGSRVGNFFGGGCPGGVCPQ